MAEEKIDMVNHKVGLVLEGGAMRGLFTTGILDVFMENGIEFDFCAAVSAGVTFGCNIKSGQIGRTLRYNKKYCNDWRYASFRSLILTGDLFGNDFCYHKIPEELDVFDNEAYMRNPMKFYAVCTDAQTGKPHYQELKDGRADIEWFRASASMPGVSHAVKIGGKAYLDGGIADSIPVKFSESMGYKKNIVILTQPSDYVKKPVKGISLLMVKMMSGKYPEIIKAVKKRHEMYNEQAEYVKAQEAAGNCFVIRPEKSLGIGHISHDADELQRVYDIGRAAGMACLPALKEFLGEDANGTL